MEVSKSVEINVVGLFIQIGTCNELISQTLSSADDHYGERHS